MAESETYEPWRRGRPVRPSAAERVGSSTSSSAQAGEFLTTAHGLRLRDTDHALKAGRRGPSLTEDFHPREKITDFDHSGFPSGLSVRVVAETEHVAFHTGNLVPGI